MTRAKAEKTYRNKENTMTKVERSSVFRIVFKRTSWFCRYECVRLTKCVEKFDLSMCLMMHADRYHSALVFKGVVQMEMSSRKFVFPTHFFRLDRPIFSVIFHSSEKNDCSYGWYQGGRSALLTGILHSGVCEGARRI